MGILAAGRRHIAQVRHEIPVTDLAMVLRIGYGQFARTPGHQIPNIMQLALVHMLSSGWLPARWAGTVALIPIFFDDLGLGQVFDPHIRPVGFVLARTQFGL